MVIPLSNPGLLKKWQPKKFNVILANPSRTRLNHDRKALVVRPLWPSRGARGTPPLGVLCRLAPSTAYSQKSLDLVMVAWAFLWPYGIAVRGKLKLKCVKKIDWEDLVECVIALEKPFYNLTMESCLLITSNQKEHSCCKVLFIDAFCEELKNEKNHQLLNAWVFSENFSNL